MKAFFKNIFTSIWVFLVVIIPFYFLMAFATYYPYNKDIYGFWHYLTRKPGWMNDNELGSSSLYWIFPYSKEKESEIYKQSKK